ncbi:hypothetical protein DH2020_010388 [Rehmannia glutinosa]|uniref:Glucan endo-1,3-beta-D-glucosidase n=1 Tax=Rehmannia glutinosa TaxID=99300 RepID=A0ABR0XAI4_REHGL
MFGRAVPGNNVSDYMMLGLGDMAIPSMLLALVLCFDHRKSRDSTTALDFQSSKGFNYFWYALCGYAVGLVTALAAGILTRSPQPALLYLVPCTLGPVIILSWMKRELTELWEGSVEAIGVSYGLNGDNLPSPQQAIALLKSRNIRKIRIFEPYPAVLNALHGSGISVVIGTRNEDLQSLSSDPSTATRWVETNIIPHSSSVNIACISAGNELFPGELAQYIPGAMQNLDTALKASNLGVPVSTAISMATLSKTYPPSQARTELHLLLWGHVPQGLFSPDAAPIMKQVTTFLQSRNYPLLVNAYTYFPHVSNPNEFSLDYALFQDTATPVTDGSLVYKNLFDATVDAVHAALERAGGANVEVVVSETGWPTKGGVDASVENAAIYNNNLVRHVSSGQGTPRRPGKGIKTYIFALFNEDLKAEGVERNWGLYYPDMTQVYHVDFETVAGGNGGGGGVTYTGPGGLAPPKKVNVS